MHRLRVPGSAVTTQIRNALRTRTFRPLSRWSQNIRFTRSGVQTADGNVVDACRSKVPRGCFGPGFLAVTTPLASFGRPEQRMIARALRELFHLKVCDRQISRLQGIGRKVLPAGCNDSAEDVRNLAALNIDETGWRQNCNKALLWTVVGTLSILFAARRSRSGREVQHRNRRKANQIQQVRFDRFYRRLHAEILDPLYDGTFCSEPNIDETCRRLSHDCCLLVFVHFRGIDHQKRGQTGLSRVGHFSKTEFRIRGADRQSESGIHCVVH